MIYKELDTLVYKDRFLVLLLSFIMVVMLWGAFEQAGGLMNLYTDDKVDKVISLLGKELLMPTDMFQSLNALFIILFATGVGSFWAKRKLKRQLSGSIFKMAIEIINVDFVFYLWYLSIYSIR